MDVEIRWSGRGYRQRTKLAWWLVGGTVALGVGGGLLLHHAFENSLADQKAQQDKFCQENHIPLSQCAGG
ncbi:MAG: hypothetical protein V4555_12020 [Acidobacteriota bacterium]